jgi:hypothetical protein
MLVSVSGLFEWEEELHISISIYYFSASALDTLSGEERRDLS